MSELQAELEALRAENARLKAENTELHPENRMRLDSAMNQMAQSARHEARQYAMIQAQGLNAPGQPSEVAYEAAAFLMEQGDF